MSYLDAVILGLVQGLTEFVPISSSGHLILVRELFHLSNQNALSVDAILQLATGLAIIVYFARDLKNFIHDRTMILAIILGTIPAVVLGLFLESKMETIFRSSSLVACMLIVGACLMYAAEKFAKQDKPLDPKRGFIVGVFQALALIPGISRSGATISGGLFLGLTREAAARFSFLLALPIILGSGLKKLLELSGTNSFGDVGLPLILGSFIAFGSGLWAIHFLINYLKNHKLTVFIWYRLVLAALILIFL